MGKSVLKDPSTKLAAGRPAMQPPADAIEVIREASQGGASYRGFAVALGCSVEVLKRWMSEDPALQQAIDEGRERERRILHDVVFQTAIAGKGKDSLLAAFMLLQNRHGYKEAEAEQSRVNVVFNLPKPMSMQDFVEITNADGTEVKQVSTAPARLTRGS